MSGPLVVLPTYNEAANIGLMIDSVIAAVPDVSVLVVDDASPDGTASVVEAAIERHPGQVSLLPRPAKLGLGTAYVAGFTVGMARGHDVLIQMDSDFQHDPAALPSLVAAIDAGADSVIGSRYVAGGSVPSEWPRSRKLLSAGANVFARMMLRLPVRDATGGFRAHRRSLLETIDLQDIRVDGYGFQIEMSHRTSRSGAAIEEVPINFGVRTRGDSKMSGRIMVEALLLVLRLSGRPNR